MTLTSKFWHPRLSNISKKAAIGTGCTIHSHCWIGDGVQIGKRCKIQAFCFIPEGVIIHDDVFIGPHTCFTNDKYPPSKDNEWLPTTVRSGASIGANCTILPGVVIGDSAVIGAGSVVTCDVPADELWYGNPARKRGMVCRK